MNNKLFDKNYVVLDGAMGTMLQQKGMELGTVPETLNITKSDWIVDIHKQYMRREQMLYMLIHLVPTVTK